MAHGVSIEYLEKQAHEREKIDPTPSQDEQISRQIRRQVHAKIGWKVAA